ncbi:mobilisation protein (MobC) [Poseidonocella pacifica]|uniref:Mobilisation protein (MobC) n=1 Tax=Poseidonocella pacifica TaxID=871651 RepID=A0A1I0WKT5_9RHOB|nr:plasmid mobilization relaxosome protein MobC [Poseidonocella pacifica]SFA88828.1 mobilisation protein (MobC) [Poseidonocella pacifica]
MSGGLKFKRKRAAPFSIRFTDAERERVEAQAGKMPVGAYIKSVVLAEDAPRYRKRRALPEEDQRLLAEILARLGASRTANNLNQIAKHLNQGTLVIDDELEADIRRACAEVAWMRATLIEALGLKGKRQ